MMKHIGLLSMIGIGSLASVLLTTEPGYAGTQKCSLATLKGTYLFTSTGYGITKKGDALPGNVSGQDIYQGNGALTDVTTASYNGVIYPQTSRFGTDTVNADCTGTVTIGKNVHLNIYIDPDGSKFVFIETDPYSVGGGTEFRVAP